jgi:acetyl-CoA C-acetyltransferase
MGRAVIVAAARTAIGTARKGSLVDVSAFDLGRWAVAEAHRRSGIPAREFDDIVLGESLQGGGDIARHAAVELGMESIPGVAMNRHCASGLTAVQTAAASIAAGMDRVVIAGGTESLSTFPVVLKRPPGKKEPQPWMPPSHPETADAPAFDMSITVGWNAAKIAGVSREDMDEWAYHSHRRAAAASDEGRFRDEIFPIEIPDGNGGSRVFELDEHPRRDTTRERLAALKPLHPEVEGFSITAGNSSGLNDGAAALVLVDEEYARAHGLAPKAIVRSWASVGVPPVRTGLAPTLAIPKALERARLTIGDVDLFEINEAFCSMAVACTRALGLDHERVNVNGSGCGLGHPVACTGARMVVTMAHELARRGGGIGVVSMCAGGGMGSAAVLEVLAA